MQQSTVDPVFGTLLQHYGLRRLNPRGLASAHKTMLLTAVAYNLKKLLTQRPQRTQLLAVALPLPHLPTADQPWTPSSLKRPLPTSTTGTSVFKVFKTVEVVE